MADSGDTGLDAGPLEISEAQAWEAIRELLAAYTWDAGDPPVELVRKGEPWHSARVLRDDHGGEVLVALEDTPDGVDAMLADPRGWAADHSCLLFELEGACARAACGEDIPPERTAEACGVVGVFPYGPHSEPVRAEMWLYDDSVGAFIEWSQAFDHLWGWQLMGCGCAITEGPARVEWYAIMAAVLGLAALIRRRES